jgi:hypothetical protein
MFTIINKKINRGFSTIELLIYSVGMVTILSVIFYLIMNMYSYYRLLTIEPRVNRIGVIVLDRVAKEIRTGRSIDLSQSQFNITTGNIFINAKSGSINTTKQFNYENGRITYRENLGTINFLTPKDMSVSRFYFNHLKSPISEGVRIELDITYQVNKETLTKKFNGFIILRHSYE